MRTRGWYPMVLAGYDGETISHQNFNLRDCCLKRNCFISVWSALQLGSRPLPASFLRWGSAVAFAATGGAFACAILPGASLNQDDDLVFSVSTGFLHVCVDACDWVGCVRGPLDRRNGLDMSAVDEGHTVCLLYDRNNSSLWPHCTATTR